MIRQLKFHCTENQMLIRSILENIKIKKTNTDSSNCVLVIFTPFIGDTILYLNVLRELEQYYHSQGNSCNIITIKQDETLIKQYCNFDELIILQYTRFLMDKAYQKQFKMKLCSQSYEKVINPYFDNLIDADLISFLVNGKEKISAERNKVYPGRFLSKSILKNSFRKSAYTRFIEGNTSSMDFIKQSKFMREIGISDFQASISYMGKTDASSIISGRPFAIIAPGASKPGKRWEPEKFASIITSLVQKHGLRIYVCGSEYEAPICKEIMNNLDNNTKEKVINYMGKTSLLEYIELIRNACIVISNDSSPVHIAASVGTPCVCIIGGWDYHRLLPYEVEKEEKNTRLPNPIYSDVKGCFNCFDHSVGYKNKECKKCIRRGIPYPCITAISVSDVEKEMEHILQELERGC